MKRLKIGLFGCGVVGSGIWTILERKSREIGRATGLVPWVERVCVRDVESDRGLSIPGAIVTRDHSEILDDPSIDVVIEVIGGEHEAYDIIRRSLASGKNVVSANKLVIAKHLPDFHALELIHGSRLSYGAAVCGSVPVIKLIDETLATDSIRSIRGILNGSTNYILGCLEKGKSYEEALHLGRVNGFLEADPSLDLSGMDAAQKLAILAWHGFGERVELEGIDVTGITGIGREDVERAAESGRRIKLIGEATRVEGRLRLSVGPVEIQRDDPLAGIDDEMNGVVIDAEGVGRQFFSGRGAGSIPTANAVLSDLLDLIRIRSGHRGVVPA